MGRCKTMYHRKENGWIGRWYEESDPEHNLQIQGHWDYDDRLKVSKTFPIGIREIEHGGELIFRENFPEVQYWEFSQSTWILKSSGWKFTVGL